MERKENMGKNMNNKKKIACLEKKLKGKGVKG